MMKGFELCNYVRGDFPLSSDSVPSVFCAKTFGNVLQVNSRIWYSKILSFCYCASSLWPFCCAPLTINHAPCVDFLLCDPVKREKQKLE